MKVLLINGSPNKDGCTNEALLEIETTLKNNKIDTEIFWIGNKPLSGCLGCSKCFKSKRCIINDKVNEFLEKAELVDGFIFGSPVHYAGPSSFLTSFMDRAFYGKPNIFKGKPAACITSCRRAGGLSTFDTEGMQTMRILANNMAWLLKCIELGKENGIIFPNPEKKVFTNFHKN